MGNAIGLLSSTLNGPLHILHQPSKFTRKLVKSSLDGEVYAFSDMLDYMPLLRECCEPFVGPSPGMIGFEDCGSLFTHLKHEKAAKEKYLARYFLGIKQSPETAELDNEYWLPGV